MKVEFEIEPTWSPGCTSGSLAMKFADTTVEVSQNGEKLGYIAAAVGGGFEVMIGSHHYFLRPQEIWRGVSKVHEERLAQEASGR